MLRLANPRKQIEFGFKQPLVREKRCVTIIITAAEKTRFLRADEVLSLKTSDVVISCDNMLIFISTARERMISIESVTKR